MARRRFFVDEVRNGRAEIAGEEAHHLTRVLRVAVGQQFEISDDRQVYLAEVQEARKDLVRFDLVRFAIVSKLDPGPPTPPVTLVCALIKFDRLEWMIEKATELGVARIVPVETERSEHGLFHAAQKRVERWRRIALEASQQARRGFLPTIEDPVGLTTHLQHRYDFRVRLEEESGALALALPVPWKEQSMALAIGPEGGWTEKERAVMNAAGWSAMSLGGNILRAETAALAGLAIVAHGWHQQQSHRNMPENAPDR